MLKSKKDHKETKETKKYKKDNSKESKEPKETIFSPYDILENLKKNNLDPSIFETIDERDFPKAPNFLEFAIGSRFLNTLILPKQIEIGTKLFCDYCPRCSKPHYIDILFDQSVGNIRDNMMFLEHGVCPKCKANRFELIKAKELIFRNELVGVAGQRSGKTKLVGLLAAYVNHRFLKIPSPIRTFNQTSGDLLSGTFSALSLEHSYKNLWQAFKGFIDGSPWFQNYHKFIKGEEKRLGIELFHELKASMFYGHKHLMWNATGSQDRKMRGDTRIFAAIDELGWMISDEEKKDLQNMNADAIYTALSNSLTTMRTKFNQIYGATNFDIPPILMANISSPSSVKDKIMRLAKDAKKNDRVLAVHAPTWLMNSDYTYESLREEHAHIDELIFLRDFGAEPPLASNPYLSEPRCVDKIAIGEPFTNIICNEYTEKDFMGDSYKSVKLIVQKSDKLIPRLLSFDLGAMKNSLAVCMFSLNHELKPKLDFALVVKPSEKGRVRANIAKFFDDFTIPLVNAFSIKHVFFDRWQSLDQVERLKNLGVNASIYSLTYKEMDSLRGAILSQSIIIPKLQKPMEQFVKEYVDDVQHIDPLALLGLQLLTVRDLGHKMTKPLLGDDDLFRAFVLGAVKLADPKIKDEYLKGAIQTKTGHIIASLGTVRLRSVSGGSSSSIGTIEGEHGKQLGLIRSRKINR